MSKPITPHCPLPLIILTASHLLAATPQSPATAAVTIEQLLTISSREKLFQGFIVKAEELANLLSQATDQHAARRLAPSVERCFLELELIALRISMLPKPQPDE